MKYILKNESLEKYLKSRHDGDHCTITIYPMLGYGPPLLYCSIHDASGALIATESVGNIVIQAVES